MHSFKHRLFGRNAPRNIAVVIISASIVTLITVSQKLSQYISRVPKALTPQLRFASMFCNKTVNFAKSVARLQRLVASLFVVMLISACGENGFDSSSGDISIFGAGIKGPLVDAIVVAYQVDVERSDLKGDIIATGYTDELAQLQMQIRGSDVSRGPFLLEYQGGRELGGEAPVIDGLQTIVTTAQLNDGSPVFATPLSSLAIFLAREDLDSASGSVTADDFIEQLGDAEDTVKAAFGMADRLDLDLFESSPILNRSEAADVTFVLRRANELFAASVDNLRIELNSDGLPQSGATIVELLAKDLSDGEFDGSENGLPLTEFSSVNDLSGTLTIDPASLTIPGTSVSFTELDDVLLDEAESLQNIVSNGAKEMLAIAAATPSNLVGISEDFVDTEGADEGSANDGSANDGNSDSDSSAGGSGDGQSGGESSSNGGNEGGDSGASGNDDDSTDSSDSSGADSGADNGSGDSGSGNSDSDNTGGSDSGSDSSGSDSSGSGDSGSSASALEITLASSSANPAIVEGGDATVTVVVDDNNAGNTSCTLDIVDESGSQAGTTIRENWAPFDFVLSKAGAVPAGEYTLDINCANKSDASLSATLATTLTVTAVPGSGDTGNGDSGSDSGDNSGSDSGSGSDGSSDTGDNSSGDNGSGNKDTGSDTSTVTADVEFSWVWPTTREDDTVLDANEIDSFELYYYRAGQTASGVSINVAAVDGNSGLVNHYVVQSLEAGTYEFAVAAVDTLGNVSAFTNPVSVTID